VYIATEFTEDTVVLDGNHPLAGLALRFELRVISVSEASEADIERERRLAEDDAD
jgi:FKBP-type peptidyl-prolyl cis-trans isomerase SlyD